MNRRERRTAASRGRVGKSRLSVIQRAAEVAAIPLPEGKRRFAISEDDGRKLAVARPAKPEVALRMASEALERQDPSMLDVDFAETGLPEAAGPYTFAGWLAEGDEGLVLGNEGEVIGRCQPGDSFITIREEGGGAAGGSEGEVRWPVQN